MTKWKKNIMELNKLCLQTSDFRDLNRNRKIENIPSSLGLPITIDDYKPTAPIDDDFYKKKDDDDISLYMRRGVAAVYTPIDAANRNNVNNVASKNNTITFHVYEHEKEEYTHKQSVDFPLSKKTKVDPELMLRFLLVGLPKFGYWTDKMTQEPSCVPNKYKVSELELGNRFVQRIYSIKENGNAAHLGFFKIGEKGYAAIGSKNEHLTICVDSFDEMKKDLLSYIVNKGTRYEEINYDDDKCLKYIDLKSQNKDFRNNRLFWAIKIAKLLIEKHGDQMLTDGPMFTYIKGKGYTIVFEAIFDDHLVDYHGEQKAICFALTKPQMMPVDIQGLCAETPIDAQRILQGFNMNFVALDICNKGDDFEKINKIYAFKHQKSDNSEGAVVYDLYLNENDVPIVGRMFKHKNFTYIIQRKAREIICGKRFHSLVRDMTLTKEKLLLDSEAVDDKTRKQIQKDADLMVLFGAWLESNPERSVNRDNFKNMINTWKREADIKNTNISRQVMNAVVFKQHQVQEDDTAGVALPKVWVNDPKTSVSTQKYADIKDCPKVMANRAGGKYGRDTEVAVILMGIQGSGKTSIRTHLVNMINESRVTYVNQDEIGNRLSFLKRLYDYTDKTVGGLEFRTCDAIAADVMEKTPNITISKMAYDVGNGKCTYDKTITTPSNTIVKSESLTSTNGRPAPDSMLKHRDKIMIVDKMSNDFSLRNDVYIKYQNVIVVKINTDVLASKNAIEKRGNAHETFRHANRGDAEVIELLEIANQNMKPVDEDEIDNYINNMTSDAKIVNANTAEALDKLKDYLPNKINGRRYVEVDFSNGAVYNARVVLRLLLREGFIEENDLQNGYEDNTMLKKFKSSVNSANEAISKKLMDGAATARRKTLKEFAAVTYWEASIKPYDESILKIKEICLATMKNVVKWNDNFHVTLMYVNGKIKDTEGADFINLSSQLEDLRVKGTPLYLAVNEIHYNSDNVALTFKLDHPNTDGLLVKQIYEDAKKLSNKPEQTGRPHVTLAFAVAAYNSVKLIESKMRITIQLETPLIVVARVAKNIPGWKK